MYLPPPIHNIFVHFHITTALYIQSFAIASTGEKREYHVFDNLPKLNFEGLTQTCARYNNSILPEPRTEEENNFLLDLDSSFIPLGLNDKKEEGVWRWDSDGSLVSWLHWHKTQPNGGRRENCAVMDKRFSSLWSDWPCVYSPVGKRNGPIRLVCQRILGMYRDVRIKSLALHHFCHDMINHAII